MTPEPVSKGVAVEIATGRRVNSFFLKHDAERGETEADDCYITLSKTLDVGTQGSGESGLFPRAEFAKRFKLG